MTNRANRVTINTTENGYEGRFYLTHRLVATVNSADTTWQADPNANSTTNRESYRTYLTEHSEEYGVAYNPTKQTQAWNRQYQSYQTDDQVFEDATTLMGMALAGVADKLGYTWQIQANGIYAKANTPTYVTEGKYEKNGYWAWADISMEITLNKEDTEYIIEWDMEMVSGQIKKPKITQAILNQRIQDEKDLQQTA